MRAHSLIFAVVALAVVCANAAALPEARSAWNVVEIANVGGRSLLEAEAEAKTRREGKLLIAGGATGADLHSGGVAEAVGAGDGAAAAAGAQGEAAAAVKGDKLATWQEALWNPAKLLDAFVASLSMILVSEIGDETFIIAALMAMRHPRGVVLAGALSALGIMTVLSTGLGLIVPNLISRRATNSAATVLYTFFGLRLLYIAWKSDPKETPEKEMEEVQEKLEEEENDKGRLRGIRRVFARFCTPIFLEAFVLTFLAEWGDRSQIATIALAAHKNALGVTVGATLGHVVCTTIAVVGGKLLALRISQRTVAMVGGSLFLVFAVHSFFSPLD